MTLKKSDVPKFLKPHLAAHRTKYPRSPFHPVAAGKADGWSVFDFGKRGWISTNLESRGINILMRWERQDLDWGMRHAIEALWRCGRITKAEAAVCEAWRAEAAKRQDREREVREARAVLAKHRARAVAA